MADKDIVPQSKAMKTRVENTGFLEPKGGKAVGVFNPWREFDTERIGLPIRRLNDRNIKVTERGIKVVVKHLERFGGDSENQLMIERLQKITAGEIRMTKYDRNFYTHELREFVRYRLLGFETGLPATIAEQEEIWQNAHTAALEDYRVKELERGTRMLYHPDVVKIAKEQYGRK